MDKRPDILVELNELSPLLATLSSENLYTIPEGYFEKLSDNILANINTGEGILSTINRHPHKNVPPGYFDSLANDILNKVKQQETENAEILSPLLSGLQKINVYKVPARYFESLTDEILSVATDTEELSPSLSGIKGVNVFTVPIGYFNSLSDGIIGRLRVEPAKLVSMGNRRSIFKYAVAAAVTGIMFFGGYKLFSPHSGTGGIAPVASLTTIQKNGVELSKDSVKMEAEYANVTDADIVKYLQSSGDDVDAAMVASTVDEKELPSQDDYLLDEKALDNFLNNIDEGHLKN